MCLCGTQKALTEGFVHVPQLRHVLLRCDRVKPLLEDSVALHFVAQFAERRQPRQHHQSARLRVRQTLHLGGDVAQRQPLLSAQEVLELRVVRRVTGGQLEVDPGEQHGEHNPVVVQLPTSHAVVSHLQSELQLQQTCR